MQRPANTQLSAKSITSMFLFLISIMYFRKSLLQKVLCLGKVWKQWGKQGNPIAQKINFAMQKKKSFWIIQAFMFISVGPNPVNYFQTGLVRTERLDCFSSENECLSCLQ